MSIPRKKESAEQFCKRVLSRHQPDWVYCGRKSVCIATADDKRLTGNCRSIEGAWKTAAKHLEEQGYE